MRSMKSSWPRICTDCQVGVRLPWHCSPDWFPVADPVWLWPTSLVWSDTSLLVPVPSSSGLLTCPLAFRPAACCYVLLLPDDWSVCLGWLCSFTRLPACVSAEFWSCILFCNWVQTQPSPPTGSGWYLPNDLSASKFIYMLFTYF